MTTPGQSRLTVLMVVLGVLLGACSGDTPEAELSPTATTGLNVNSEVGLRNLGPISIGMTVEQLAQAAQVEMIRQPDYDTAIAATNCAYMSPATIPGYVPPPNSGNKSPIAFMIVDGMLARIDILGGDFQTSTGIQVGSSEQEVQAAFGGSSPLPPRAFIGPPFRYLTATPRGEDLENFRLVFESDGAKVVQFRVGQLPQVEWKTGCTQPGTQEGVEGGAEQEGAEQEGVDDAQQEE